MIGKLSSYTDNKISINKKPVFISIPSVVIQRSYLFLYPKLMGINYIMLGKIIRPTTDIHDIGIYEYMLKIGPGGFRGCETGHCFH